MPRMVSCNMRIACNAGSTLGGTQKAAWSYAAGLAKLGHEVKVLTSPGPMGQNFADAAFEVVELHSSLEWEQFYMSGWPEVVHHHAPGYANTSIFYDILEKMQKRLFRVVETNVFGWLTDPRSHQHVDFRLFISMASGAQAFLRAGIRDPQSLLNNYSVLYYPVEKLLPLPPTERAAFRRDLGVGDDEVLVVRLGRPDARKWRDWECRAFQKARHKDARLVFLMIEPPANIRKQIESRKFGPGFIIKSLVSSQEWLSRLNRSSDIMLHAAICGESFGYTIAEGMAAGLPIVTRSTPWGDNAQVELVENGKTGYVCESISGLAHALEGLTKDPVKRRALGAAAKLRIRTLADPDHEARLLEEICSFLPSPGPLMVARNQDFRLFLNRFSDLENYTYEVSQNASDPLNICWSRAEKRCRILKSHVRKIKAGIRTSLGLSAYAG